MSIGIYAYLLDLRLFDLCVHFCPLYHLRNPPKLHRIFRTCVSPVVAFYSMKFGLNLAKLELRIQNTSIAIYAYLLDLRLFDLCVHFFPLYHVRNPPKLHRTFRTCVSPVVAFYSMKFGLNLAKLELRMQNMSIAIYT